jgi:methylthioribose-1-phosphate isomerase
MKSLMKINLVALMVIAFCTIGMAQNEKQRMSREQLAEKQAKHIAQELSFDEATTQRFIETYCACQQEVWALGPRQKAETVTEEEAEQVIKERLERSRAVLDLREKYYEEYSKFLTQRQILRVFELEHQAMDRLHKHREHNQKGHERHQKE